MPSLDTCINGLFEPGNIPATSGQPPTVPVPSASFIAAGYDAGPLPAIWKSGTGVTWSIKTSAPATDGAWWGSSDLDGLFIVVGIPDVGTVSLISTSTDGVTWTARTSPENGGLYNVNCDGVLAVAVGFDDASPPDPVILTSPTGSTWTSRTAGVSDAVLHGATHGASKYVVVGVSSTDVPVILTSPDCVTWTSQTAAPAANYSIQDIAFGGSLFAAVGIETSGSDGSISTSADGVTWATQTVPAFATSTLNAIAYGSSKFVAVGDAVGDALVLTSADGVTWTQRTISGTNVVLYDVSISGTTWCVVGQNTGTSECVIFTSPDAITWTSQTPADVDTFLLTVHGR